MVLKIYSKEKAYLWIWMTAEATHPSGLKCLHEARSSNFLITTSRDDIVVDSIVGVIPVAYNTPMIDPLHCRNLIRY